MANALLPTVSAPLLVGGPTTQTLRCCGDDADLRRRAYRIEPRLLIVAQRGVEVLEVGANCLDACSPPRRTPHSLLRLVAIQIVERKYNLPGLTPKSGFIATKAVEGIIGQIAESQETTCELNIRSNLALG
jgi:hypothetical protein